jgi:hypothetical protein
MFDSSKLNYKKGNDYLQTRVRHPRSVMPNFALYCDWIIWDRQHIYVDFNSPPATIYVRSEINALNYFISTVLGDIKSNFILVTSSHDTPMPIGFQENFNLNWEVIVNNKYLKVWFTENRDLIHEKIKPIPLGIPHPDLPSWVEKENDSSLVVWSDDFIEKAQSLRNPDRLFKIFGCWYPRVNHPSGTCPQNNNERQMAYESLISKKEIFDWYQPGMSRMEFIRQLGSYQFVLCPHGGGLDPNPKCWEALIMGAIPIVKRNSMSESLQHLPIAFVDEWSEITLKKLVHWGEVYRPRLQVENLEYLMSNAYYHNEIMRHLKEC